MPNGQKSPPLASKSLKNQAKHDAKEAAERKTQEWNLWYELGYKNTCFIYFLVVLLLLESECIEVAIYLLWNIMVSASFIVASCQRDKIFLKCMLTVSHLTNVISIFLIGMNIVMPFQRKQYDPTHFAYSARKQWITSFPIPAVASFGSAFFTVFYYSCIVSANLTRMRFIEELLD